MTLKVYAASQNIIKSKCHQIGSYNIRKSALSAFDRKRWICCDGISTLAYGHWRINDIKCADGKCIHKIDL